MNRLIHQVKKGLATDKGQKMIRHLWLVPAICIIWTVLSYNVRTFGLTGRVTRAIENYKTTEQAAAEELKKPSKTAEEMQKRNPFSGAQPTPSKPQCMGILGSYALFGDQWYKVGDTVQEAKILAIAPDGVKILWQDKEQTLQPFDVETQYKSSTPAGGQTAQASTQSQQQEMQSMGPPMRFGGFDPRTMSPEQLAQMRDRFMNMSPEERRRAFEEMRGRRGQ